MNNHDPRTATNPPVPGDAIDFETLWKDVQPKVLGYCTRELRDLHRAEDVVQNVWRRVWRNYSQFRGEAPIVAWIFAIARREISRESARFLEENRRKADDQELLENLPAIETEQIENVSGLPTAELIASAVNAGEISRLEADILCARMEYPPPSWKDLAQRFEQSATACAAAHCRAIPRLRVFICVHRPEWLGTSAMYRDAFGRALATDSDPLLPREAEAFRMIVLERRPYRRTGWRTALRSACGKVMEHLRRG